MLSSPINNTQSNALQTRRRLHQRQKSMPVAAFEAMKMSGSPSTQVQAQAKAQVQAQAHADAQARSLAMQAHANSSAQAQAAVSRQASHRRGQSLDTRRQQLQQRQQRQQHIQQVQGHARGHSRSQSQSQNQYMGPNTTTQQHVMRETQTQNTVRSGHAALQQQPQQQQQQQQCSAASFDYYNEPTAAMMRKTLSGGCQPINQQDFQLFATPSSAQQQALNSPIAFINFQDANSTAVFASSAPSPQGWASEEETASTRRSARRVSHGILDRVAKFEGMQSMDGMQRPATPPNNAAYFPPTPTELPLERMQNFPGSARLDRFSDEYDDSMEETLKPVRRGGHQSNRSSGVFDDLRQQAEALALATPQRPGMMQVPMIAADFMAMNSFNAEFLKMQQNGSYVPMPVPADMQHLSPPQSQHPTPSNVQGVFDGNILSNPGVFDTKSDLWATEYGSQASVSPFMPTQPASPSYSESPEESSNVHSARSAYAHKRNESMASIASAASISSINIDETRTETGVTTDDIAAYIEGPNAVDGKWRCTFEKCDKRFGRKENIKSHVQTHLNDRQYQCPHCQKCFVRQHDLKRHAKIHTGIKPYPCECGNNFARHDALTRHRQRGMCIGAFDGAVRKVGKRGRPRKARPSLDLRREKSTRTRSKNAKSGNPSSPETSSYSGYSDNSDNSAGNSPRSKDSGSPFEDEQFMDDELIDMDFAQPVSASSTSASTSTIRGTMNPSALAMSSAPMPGAGMSGMSPSAMSHYSQHSQHSHHSHQSHHSHHSHASMPGSGGKGDADNMLSASHAASPTKSVASHYTQHPSTPSELSSSSSPPQMTSSARFFKLDPDSSCTEDDSLVGSLSAPLTDDGCGPLGLDVVDVDGVPSSPLEDELMLMKAYSGDDVLVQLDNSGLSMLNTSKFEDEYGMFTNNDDVFFGN